MPYQIFIVYPKQIADLRDELIGHFAALERAGEVECWYDEKIRRGDPVHEEIMRHLEAADMVLLLTCAEFFSSDYIQDKELPLARKLHDEGRAVVIPILVKPYVATGFITELAALPNNRKPVTAWSDRTEAWCDVVGRLKKDYFDARPTNANDSKTSARTWAQDTTNACLELRPFNSIREQVREAIGKADSIWVLCRTGLGLWQDFGDKLGRFYLPHSSSRLIVIDPQGEAFRSTRHEWIPWHLKPGQSFDNYQDRFEGRLKELCPNSQKEIIIKKINVLLPLLVLIVNPGVQEKTRTVMFIEYPTNGSAGKFTHGGYQDKPWLKVTPQDHPLFFDGFYRSFLDFWDKAEPYCPE